MSPPEQSKEDPLTVNGVSASTLGQFEGENRWLRFGLSTNPYFVEPLNSETHGARPITLFQGRDAALKEILDTIAGEQNSLILVEGPSGVGKSTYINFVKHELREAYFAAPNEVGVQSGTTAESLLLAALDSIVRHASDTHPEARWDRNYPSIHSARQMVLALRSMGWGFTAGIGVPGIGGIGASRPAGIQPPIIGPVLTPMFFGNLALELKTLDSPAREGVIVHVNNLDTIVSSSPKRATALFCDLREFFQIPAMHWVFLGPPGLHSEIVAGERRLLPFVKASIELEKLPPKDVDRLLDKRYVHYKVRDDWVKPTQPALVKALFEKFGGDLRGTLNALSLAHKFYSPIDVKPMSDAEGIEYLTKIYNRRLEKQLKGKTFEILKHIIALKKEEFTQDDVTGVETHQSNRSVRFSEMETWDAIRLVRTEGARKIYTYGGAARIAFGL